MKDVETLELSSGPLEQLALLLEEIYVPLLSNAKNHERWPEVLMQDIMRHIQQVCVNIYDECIIKPYSLWPVHRLLLE